MSNYLAIATVTAALQRLLQDGIREDVPGAIVTTVRPDHTAAMNQSIGINVYLYQAIPNPAWRNSDLRTRRPKKDLIKHGQAGLDLHYLLTFYGNEQELEPQRLMGSAIRTLVDQPTLTREMIQATIDQTNLSFLASSTLADQVQLVQFIPSTITTEDLSRIWSVFFQIPYSLSFAYQGMAVLIQGEKPGKTALPVRKRQFYVASSRPVIDKIEFEKPIIPGVRPEEDAASSREPEPLTRSSPMILRIQGRRLQGDRIQVRIGRVEVTPQSVTDAEVRVQLSALHPRESSLLRAGVQGIQVVQSFQPRSANADFEVESNVMPLVLCPSIVNGDRGLVLSDPIEQDEDVYRGTITVQLDVTISPEQRAFLLLNDVETANSHIFRASRRTAEESHLTFSFQDVMAGTYFVRVQVDGAESPLTATDEEYTGPTIVIS